MKIIRCPKVCADIHPYIHSQILAQLKLRRGQRFSIFCSTFSGLHFFKFERKEDKMAPGLGKNHKILVASGKISSRQKFHSNLKSDCFR